MATEKIREKIPALIKKYKYAAAVLLVGIFLMLLPTNTSRRQAVPQTEPVQQTDTPTITQELEQILSQVEGAGRVKVLLTQAKGERITYQTDGTSSDSDTGSTQSHSTVTVTDPNKNQSGLIVQIEPPVYQGALVVSQGADSATVKLALVEAVSKVTGLGANQITVLKMK